MLKVADTFRNALLNDNRNYTQTFEITLADSSELTLTNEDIWSGSVSLEGAVSSDNNLDLGSTVIRKLSFTINNIDGTYTSTDSNGTSIDFTDAQVVYSIGLDGVTSGTGGDLTYQLGEFYVDEAIYSGSLIQISCLDAMTKFDKDYSTYSQITYPASVSAIANDACSCCGVTMGSIPAHSAYIVPNPPTDNDNTTFREVIGHVAGACGYNCVINRLGKLDFVPYDFSGLETALDDLNDGVITDPETELPRDYGIHYLTSFSSSNIGIDPVVITGFGVSATIDDEDISIISGAEGYVLTMADNPIHTLSESTQSTYITVQQTATYLGSIFTGVSFYTATLSHLSNPEIEPGDGAIVYLKGKYYPVIISSTTFSPFNYQSTRSSAQTPMRNSASRFSEAMKIRENLRGLIQEEKTAREAMYDELVEYIDSHEGLYRIEEQTSDGYIYYLCDAPTVAESTVIWKMTRYAWAVSTDGGTTWNAGMTMDGEFLARTISTIGLDATWISTGELDANFIRLFGLMTVYQDDCWAEISATSQSTSGSTITYTVSANPGAKYRVTGYSNDADTSYIIAYDSSDSEIATLVAGLLTEGSYVITMPSSTSYFKIYSYGTSVIESYTESEIGGYIGYGEGRVSDAETTSGVMLSNTDNIGTSYNTHYVIATEAGARMTAGDSHIYVVDDGASVEADGPITLKSESIVVDNGDTSSTALTAVSTMGNGSITTINGLITYVAEVSGADIHYTDPDTGSHSAVQLSGGEKILIVNGIVTSFTESGIDLTEVPSQISTIQSNITTLQGQVSTLESSMTTAEGDITSLEIRVSELETSVSSLETSLETLQSTVTSIQESIEAGLVAIFG